jgi:hypothetical protein
MVFQMLTELHSKIDVVFYEKYTKWLIFCLNHLSRDLLSRGQRVLKTLLVMAREP